MIASAMSASRRLKPRTRLGLVRRISMLSSRRRPALWATKVKLADQFGASGAKVPKPIVLCAPVRDKRTYLMWYEDEGPKAADKKVAVTNQFGTETLTVGGPWRLCVPSLKTVPHQ